jgi:hypothetical protein
MTTSIDKSTGGGGHITFRGPDADRPEYKGIFPSTTNGRLL